MPSLKGAAGRVSSAPNLRAPCHPAAYRSAAKCGEHAPDETGLGGRVADSVTTRGAGGWTGWFIRSESARGWALLSPTFILMVAGIAAPLAIMAAYSVWTKTPAGIDTSITFANYWRVITRLDPVLLRSLWISGITTLVTVLIAYPVAYYVAFKVQKTKFLWLILLTIPFWTSYLLRVFAWRVILPEEMMFTQNAVIIALAHSWAAFAFLPIYVSLEKVDRTLLEAAADLGDTGWQSFWRITFPLSVPGIVSAAMLIFVPTIGDYVTPTLVGGGKPASTMIANIIQGQIKSNDWPMAAATAFVSMAMVAFTVFIAAWALRLAARSIR